MLRARLGLLALWSIAVCGPAPADVPIRKVLNPLYLCEEPASTPTSEPASNPTTDESAPRPLLMRALDHFGLSKPLDDAGIVITGYVEASYTQGFQSPPGNILTLRSFDFESETLPLNQLDLSVAREIDISKDKWDLGFKIEWQYGSDARFQHSNGLFDYYDVENGPAQQWDLTECWVDVNVPVGNGLKVRLGKWITPPGVELVNPVGNTLYSHGWIFNFALPYTHTGMVATYPITEQTTVELGFSRGWDQCLDDNNSAIDGVSRITTTCTEEITSCFCFLFGPQQDDNSGDWRYCLDEIVTWQMSERLVLNIEGNMGIEGAAADDGGTAWWWGVGAWPSYTLNDSLSINARGEWFRDPNGARVGFGENNYYNVTLGLGITPFPTHNIGRNLIIRPEIRFDYADSAVFDNESCHYQWTAAVDAIFTF